MRRALYDFFGLPKIPRKDEPDEVEDEILEAEVSPNPIEIPQPVRARSNNPLHEMDFHDLGERKWLEWAANYQRIPHRGLRYIKPDEMHRLPLDRIVTRLSQGDILIIDLFSLAHMDSQRSALARQVQDVAATGGLPVFALDEKERLLLVPGRGSRVDSETYNLGLKTAPL
ncbi:MAG: hypothetical protein QF440_01930 [Candidatus Thalassarchaeaceae archaeon]|jgi:hypothetical protein|nr:hypothetical protein [Candidatus Thalassarchaeaceae archaeon]